MKNSITIASYEDIELFISLIVSVKLIKLINYKYIVIQLIK